MTGSKKLVPLPPKSPDKMDQVFIKTLLEDRKIKPAIDRRYSLGELHDAFCYLEKGHTRGKVVITI
jgi:NADPH:quinone reductase-like Zn-dependent oxidoreductase